MFSAEMLSWILGARRFSSIARICDSRTPVTVTSFNSSASGRAAADLAFLASGDGVVGPPCCAGSCAPAFCAGALVCSDAMADVAAAASNAMDMAIDRGACDIGLTRPLPLDCYLPDLRCPRYIERRRHGVVETRYLSPDRSP